MDAPIIIFSYNRPKHLNNLLDSLIENRPPKLSKIFLFCDGPKNKYDQKKIKEIKKLLKKKKISIKYKTFRKKNIGLANNIIAGVNEVLLKHKSCIVLEDDLVLNRNCINFMNTILDKFKNQKNIGSVSAHSYIDEFKSKKNFDFYISKRHSSWCWGTWSRVWNKIDWNSKHLNQHFNNKSSINRLAEAGKDLNLLLWGNSEKLINSWAIRFNFHCINRSLKSIQPRFSMIINNGRDFSGTHEKFYFKINKKFNFNPLLGSLKNILNRTIESKEIYSFIKHTHRRSYKLSLRFFIKYLKII